MKNFFQKMKGWQKGLLIAALAIVTLLLAVIIIGYAIFSHYYNKMNIQPVDPDITEEIIVDISDDLWDPGDDDPITDPELTPTPEITGSVQQTPSTSGNSSVTEQPVTGSASITNAPVTTLPPVTVPPVTSSGKYDNYVINFGKHVRNILLVGTDGRTLEERGRTDTMILLSINEKTGKIILTSFMRDIYVYIPGVRGEDYHNRLNAAYAHGGITLLMKTLKENFKIKIDEYVRLNFQSFEKIVDILGGVDIELSQEEINYLRLGSSVKPGLVHLNGARALEYCRCRKVPKNGYGSDYARTERQREFLSIMFDKLKGMSLSNVKSILDAVLPNVYTNLTQSDILGLLAKFPTYIKYDIVSQRVPKPGTHESAKINGASVIAVDFDKNIEFLESSIGGK